MLSLSPISSKFLCQVYTVISGAATTQLATLFLAAYEMGFTIKRVPSCYTCEL